MRPALFLLLLSVTGCASFNTPSPGERLETPSQFVPTSAGPDSDSAGVTDANADPSVKPAPGHL